MKTKPVLRSVYESQDEILNAIKSLHCPKGFDCDMTYGRGVFWKKIKKPALCYDITPMCPGVIAGDSRMLPLEQQSISSAVFDPPFLTYIRNGRAHKNGAMALSKRFGGYWSYAELEDHYRDSISEAYRVLKSHGKFIVKTQDIIHNHKMHATHVRVIQMADIEGFRLLDQFILVAQHRMPSPQKGKQRHARIHHCFFLVFEKRA